MSDYVTKLWEKFTARQQVRDEAVAARTERGEKDDEAFRALTRSQTLPLRPLPPEQTPDEVQALRSILRHLHAMVGTVVNTRTSASPEQMEKLIEDVYRFLSVEVEGMPKV